MTGGGETGRQHPALDRIAGVVWAVVSAWGGLVLLVRGGLGCDEGCREPGPTISWRSTREAWQWDVLIGAGMLVLVLAVIVLVLAVLPKLRRRALFGTACAQVVGVALTLAAVYLPPERDEDPPEPVVTELPTAPLELRLCGRSRCFEQTMRLPEGWGGYSVGDPGEPLDERQRYIEKPFGDCSLRAYPWDERLIRGGASDGSTIARSLLGGRTSILGLDPAPNRHLLIGQGYRREDGLSSAAIVWRHFGAGGRTVVLVLHLAIGCPRDYPRETLDSDLAVAAEGDLLRTIATSVRLVEITQRSGAEPSPR